MSSWDDDLTKLKDWHRRALATGVDGAERLNDAVLRQVAQSQRRTGPEIEMILLPDQRVFAVDLADVLAESDRDPAPSEVPDEHRADPEPGPDLDALPFARYVGVDRAKARVTCTDGPDGLALDWPPWETEAGVVVYRVVTADDRFAPQSPEDGDLLPATTALSLLDPRPFTGAVRRVLVFAHAGPSVAAAAAAEPVLHAEGAAVAPVVGVHVREDEGIVVGEWSAWEGTVAVQVLRVPAERRAGSGDPQYRILPDSRNLDGFVDPEAERGRTYRYELVAVAAVDGVEMLARPHVVELTVSVTLRPVVDLDVELVSCAGNPGHESADPGGSSQGAARSSYRVSSQGRQRREGPPGPSNHAVDFRRGTLVDGDDPVFDLRWTPPPVGKVVIYRSAEPPAADGPLQVRDESALPGAGLLAADRLVHPTRPGAEHGRVEMRRVPWPRGTSTVWFTPVTLFGREARVGPSRLRVRTGEVEAPVIVERVHKQIVTFGWPEGATAVLAYPDLVGRHTPPPPDAPHQSVTRSEYEQRGGMHLDDPLPSRGCTLYLVPVAYVAGRRVDGPPARTSYRGLLRMQYSITLNKNWKGRPQGLAVWIRSELELPQPPPLALVHNVDRLPLDIDDGRRLLAVPSWNAGQPPSPQLLPPALTGATRELAWTVPVAKLTGYVRLFVDVPTAELAGVALLDPPLEQLRITAAQTLWAWS